MADKIEHGEFSATALEDIVFGILTAIRRIVSIDEEADISGSTVEQLLVNAANWHPEPNVANYLRHEIHRLFEDFPMEVRHETNQ